MAKSKQRKLLPSPLGDFSNPSSIRPGELILVAWPQGSSPGIFLDVHGANFHYYELSVYNTKRLEQNRAPYRQRRKEYGHSPVFRRYSLELLTPEELAIYEQLKDHV